MFILQLSCLLAFHPGIGLLRRSFKLNALHPDDEQLFAGEEEIMDVAEAYILAKYKGCDENGCRMFCDKEEAREVLQSVLPPVTPTELNTEVDYIMDLIMKTSGVDTDEIDETVFVKAICQNTYWRAAGSLVVKELMYFDALYAFYKTGYALLSDDDYEVLKENLTWEGSSVATMSGKEATFVSAVASSRRGSPILSDVEYDSLKSELLASKSWVTNRAPDALEKLGLNTFMGYLHRAL
jgi:hypothetical protein